MESSSDESSDSSSDESEKELVDSGAFAKVKPSSVHLNSVGPVPNEAPSDVNLTVHGSTYPR